jgi:mannose-6-phosphate isomerase-like protein (cupin superfamily)
MSTRWSAAEGLAAARAADDRIYGVLLARGTLELGFYAPRGSDRQSPHEQDEIYVVQAGHGHFEMAGNSRPCAAGDALFVPAGTVHRFHDFSDDFAAWVIFYGPPGGESE